MTTIEYPQPEGGGTVTGAAGRLLHSLDTTPSRESVLAEWRLEAACRGMSPSLFFV